METTKIESKKLILDYQALASKYPEAIKKVENYFSRREDIMEGLKDMGYDPKQTSKELTHFVGMIIQYDPRRLFDVFDYFDIFVNITKGDGHWTYFITDSVHSFSAQDRIEAEIAVFDEAFKILNQQ